MDRLVLGLKPQATVGAPLQGAKAEDAAGVFGLRLGASHPEGVPRQ